jgi:methylisocitrate lyase
MEQRKALRRMLKAGETVVAPCGFDPLSMRIVEHLGFKAAYLGGWVMGAASCSSEPFLSLSEVTELAGRCAKAVNIPLIVDADAGWGDPVHTMHTVQEFEYAGAAAIHIEDQVYPKRLHYHRFVRHVIPLEEFEEKIRMALRARTDPDFLIIARTDVRHAVDGSFEETVRRVRRLAELGVDAIMPRLRDFQEMETLRREVPEVVLVSGIGSPTTPMYGVPFQRLASLGYNLIIVPVFPYLIALGAFLEAYKGLRDKGTLDYDPSRLNEVRELVEHLLRFPEYWRVEEETTERAR